MAIAVTFALSTSTHNLYDLYMPDGEASAIWGCELTLHHLLTQKTLFLLATAGRMSEIHALDTGQTRFETGHHENLYT